MLELDQELDDELDRIPELERLPELEELALGILRPTAGSVAINGHDMATHRMAALRELADVVRDSAPDCVELVRGSVVQAE